MFSDQSTLLDYSYPIATYSDLKNKIKIYFGDVKDCSNPSQFIDKTTLKDTAKKVAEAFGRIPDYIKGGWSAFEIESGCKQT